METAFLICKQECVFLVLEAITVGRSFVMVADFLEGMFLSTSD